MPPASDVADFHLGMLNPPRRVKRLRELALKDTPHPVVVPGPLVPASPSLRAPTPPPAPAAPAAPRRRGRKPAGPLSKSAREQLRKTNHSVIEKRRREKINEALAALRDLVPNDKHDGEKEDKEFKLEVLVRTVEYLRVMVDKVEHLERSALCQKCGAHLPAAAASSAGPVDAHLPRLVKRKRAQYEAASPPEHFDHEKEDLDPAPAQGPSASKVPAEPRPTARLPSIASWMHDSPAAASQPAPHTYQLPSPPHTAPFAPITIASTGFPPRLVLPSPIGPNSPSMRYRAAAAHHHGSPSLERTTSPSESAFASRDGPSSSDRDVPELPLDTVTPAGPLPRAALPEHTYEPTTANHTLSPSPSLSFHVDPSLTLPRMLATTSRSGERQSQSASPGSPWSRDDQTAASLLLNISSRHSRSGSGSGSASASDEEKAQDGDVRSMLGDSSFMARRGFQGLSAQTPSSLLGMAEDSAGDT